MTITTRSQKNSTFEYVQKHDKQIKKFEHLTSVKYSPNYSEFCCVHVKKTKNNIHCVISSMFSNNFDKHANKNQNIKTLWSISGGQIGSNTQISPSIGSNSSTQNKKITVSSGSRKGGRKTGYNERMVYKSVIEKLLGLGLKYVILHCTGTTHPARKKHIVTTFSKQFPIVLFRDLTNCAHNGCRPRKKRRL